MNTQRLVIVDGVRTAFCKAGTDLAHKGPDELGRVAVNALLTRTGLDPALVPASVAALREYFQTVDDELRPSPYSRDAAKVVLNPPLPLPIRFLKPIAWIPGAAAAGLMPRRLRAMHGIPWVPPADAAVRVAATALTRAMGVLPDPPHLRAAKARWAEAEAA